MVAQNEMGPDRRGVLPAMRSVRFRAAPLEEWRDLPYVHGIRRDDRSWKEDLASAALWWLLIGWCISGWIGLAVVIRWISNVL